MNCSDKDLNTFYSACYSIIIAHTIPASTLLSAHSCQVYALLKASITSSSMEDLSCNIDSRTAK